MGYLVRPNTKHDFCVNYINGDNLFWIKEMCMFSQNSNTVYQIVIIDSKIFVKNDEIDCLFELMDDFSEQVNSAYKKWLISKALKEKLK